MANYGTGSLALSRQRLLESRKHETLHEVHIGREIFSVMASSNVEAYAKARRALAVRKAAAKARKVAR